MFILYKEDFNTLLNNDLGLSMALFETHNPQITNKAYIFDDISEEEIQEIQEALGG